MALNNIGGRKKLKIKKLFRNKKAFSAVIASLILMLLAVAAGVVVYSYVMGWVGGATKDPTRAGEIQLDSIYASASAGKIQMYVRNVGGTDLTLSTIYVGGVAVNNNTAITSTTSLLHVQNTAYLEVNYTMSNHYFYDVSVVCNDGTTASQSVEAN